MRKPQVNLNDNLWHLYPFILLVWNWLSPAMKFCLNNGHALYCQKELLGLKDMVSPFILENDQPLQRGIQRYHVISFWGLPLAFSFPSAPYAGDVLRHFPHVCTLACSALGYEPTPYQTSGQGVPPPYSREVGGQKPPPHPGGDRGTRLPQPPGSSRDDHPQQGVGRQRTVRG